MHRYQIRKLTTNNKTGDAFGITIPSGIAANQSGIYFSMDTGACFTEYRNEIIETINAALRNISDTVPQQQFPAFKKQWYALRQSITEIETPLNHSIILTSGCCMRESNE